MKSTIHISESDDIAARAAHELIQLKKQTAKARSLLARLQKDLVNVGNKLGSEATLLIEANQQLVVSTMYAQTRAAMVERSAEHDVLTGLPNRILLLDRFTQAIVAAKRSGGCLALLFLDINDFKHINDSLGHGVGDQVLQHVAHCLTAVIRQADTVSRHGGDEFLILLAEIAHFSDAILIADKIHASLRARHRFGDQELSLTVSIGISLYPDHSEDTAELIEHADLAMYHAKRNGLSSYVYHGDKIPGDKNSESALSPSPIASPHSTARDKSESLSRISHELLPPVNTILRLSHHMRMDNDASGYLDCTQLARLESIELACQQLLLLTENLLDIAKIERDL